MRKIGVILFIALFIAGCSAVKRGKSNNDIVSKKGLTGNILERTVNQNVTKNSFYIQKADIEVNTPEGNEKLLGSVKFENPDKYLIIIKSRTGIEAVRIYISNDTILINDRINKKLYCGSTEYLKKRYGISTSVLPVILGDFVGDKYSEGKKTDCLNGKFSISGLIKGIKINYVIDCKYGKTISAISESSVYKEGIVIKYDDFKTINDITIPGRINIKDLQSKTTIEINILKIVNSLEGTIDFIPGKKYEILQLL